MLHVFLFATVLAVGGDSVRAGEDIVRAMHDRYAGKWYETLALVQTVNYYDAETGAYDSARVWYESIQLPGVVRSDVAPLDAGNRFLYKDETWYDFRADTVYSAQPGPHPLLLLGFDVYVQPVEETIAKLEQFRIDVSKVREDEWQGRGVYVVGSSSADDDSRQFWVDKEHLLFVRLLLTDPSTKQTREVRFEGYERLGGGWIATEIVFMRGDRSTMVEQYNYWTIDVEFDPSLFTDTKGTRPKWVRN
ncbi:MAG: outer membrane lipoprotein-sorting protein [Gemmatimonadales bacterium]|nr:outer membrane lipoprotein-sorting protein [Gemmatimonadales bacterium]NIN13228.1 outer membrane lipoprotein-sorting protein [Gemmatimonadales bacterium]NIN51245.1 outer membrane lipoprotein-sorting protein [Gemmatimonadales bacterium]NIP08709.1 outer membrane lipoprotein-sorting protein [Gemmatimonadales bacterium]NIR00962.1 outer membrane lipoprotein-sorting protein [Gemmatimonadales bacterium]